MRSWTIALSLLAACGSRPPNSEVATACQLKVKEMLKSPKSADFPFDDVAKVKPLGNGYRLASYVDSQNGFGANIRTNYVCDASGDGSYWNVKVTFN